MKDLLNLNYKNLVLNFKKQVLEHKKDWFPNGLNCISKEHFLKDNVNSESIFNTIDFDKDGFITEREIEHIKIIDDNHNGVLEESELNKNKENVMKEALFFARRNIDKWFSIDINRDGKWSEVENTLAEPRMRGDDPNKEHQLDASMTHEELAKKYNLPNSTEKNFYDLNKWMDEWAIYLKEIILDQYGVELSDADMINIKKEMIKQLNTWLFKTGDNETGDAPLYNSLNEDSYTRLMTHDAAVSCCGGEITPPPAAPSKNTCEKLFNSFEYTPEEREMLRDLEIKAENGEITEEEYLEKRKELELHNTADEVKNRLAWAMYAEPARVREIKQEIKNEIQAKIESGEISQEEANNMEISVWERMTDEEYQQYHEQYMQIRNMTASDFRDLLKPENEEKRKEFEKNSWMAVSQIVQYINIVESETGVDFDSSEWVINQEQFSKISDKVNDINNDENLLEEKTLDDIPENRKNLFKFLEENGWLHDQFK